VVVVVVVLVVVIAVIVVVVVVVVAVISSACVKRVRQVATAGTAPSSVNVLAVSVILRQDSVSVRLADLDQTALKVGHYITLHRNYLKSPMVKNC